MSTMSIPTTLGELQALRQEVECRIAALIGPSGAVVAFAKAKGPKGHKEPKEPKAKRASGPSAWGEWSKKVFAEQKAEIEAYKAACEVKQGAHLKWLGAGGDKNGVHEEPGPGCERFGSKSPAWAAFKAEWATTHPKGSGASVSGASAGGSVSGGSDVEAEAPVEPPKKRRGPKKMADMTPEELAVREAKKAEKAAKKTQEEDTAREATPFGRPEPASMGGGGAAPAPVAAAAVAEDEEAEEVDLLPYVIDGTRYVRPGVKDEAGTITWASGDLWFYKKTAAKNRGDYVGCVDDDGIIDSNAEEPNLSL